MANAGLDITAAGLVSPVGLNAASACAAIRARIAGFGDTAFVDGQGEPIVGAAVPLGDGNGQPEGRLVALLARALRDCLSSEKSVSTERIPLLVGVAEPDRPGLTMKSEAIVRGVEAKLGMRFHPKLSRAVPKGHVSTFEALKLAGECLNDPAVPACLVGAVDSYLSEGTLRGLASQERLKDSENPDGVIPGEAAGAVLVKRPGTSNPKGSFRVIGLGFGQEKASVATEDPLLGLGLADAARAALAQAGKAMHEVDFRLADLTGESYGFREQALVLSRLMRTGRAGFPIWHPADAIGDTGAAAGVCQLVIAFYAFQRQYAPGDRAICFTSAVAGDRAVAVIERLRV